MYGQFIKGDIERFHPSVIFQSGNIVHMKANRIQTFDHSFLICFIESFKVFSVVSLLSLALYRI